MQISYLHERNSPRGDYEKHVVNKSKSICSPLFIQNN